ncbi:MAG: PHP domain-containing protein, partial [Planctomycetota bacterium]
MVLLVCCCAVVVGLEIDNPYADVDWSQAQRLKVNLHTHTKRSDGRMEPAVVIDAYRAQDYAALAITDHNRATWPWTAFGRDPDEIGMFAIAGNEFSNGHHRNALFAPVAENPGADVARSAHMVAAAGGLLQLNHPGRYDKPPQWYVDLIREHEVIVSL